MKRTIAKLALGFLILTGSLASSLAAPGDIYAGGLSSNAIYVLDPVSGVRTVFLSNSSDLNVSSLAFAPSGYLFAVNGTSILRITPSGMSTFATGVAPNPVGNTIAFDTAGNLFLGDTSTKSILKFTPAGVQSTFAGPFSNPPYCIAFDPSGNLYVATGTPSTGTGAIFKVAPNGNTTPFASGLSQPQGLAVDASANVYESDYLSGHIYKFTPAGVQTTFFSMTNPTSLAFDSSGNLYAYGFQSQQIVKIAPNGTGTNFGPQGTFVGGLAVAPPNEPPVKGDFNQNVYSDFLLYNSATRQSAVWFLGGTLGTTFSGGLYGPTVPTGWSVVGAADINQDGKSDYVLFNSTTRQTAVWFLDGTTLVSGVYGPTLPQGWSLVAAVDMNNDGHPDFLLFDSVTRQTAVWYMNGATFVAGAYGPTLPPGWTLVEAAYFNSDTSIDYLLFSPSTRQTAVWFLNGTSFAGGQYGPTLPVGWTLIGSADFNRDNQLDLALFSPGTRQTAVWYLNGLAFSSGAYGPTLPANWKLLFP